MQLMTSRWAMAGSALPHGLLSASSDQPLLAAYAVKRPDHLLGLIVVNKDKVNSYNAAINLSGFVPNASAGRWTFDSSNYAWETTTSPYHASPDNAPTSGTQAGISTSFARTFLPYSITVFRLTDASIATDTPTASPTVTATPTITLIPTLTLTPTITSTPTITATPSNPNVLYPNPLKDTAPLSFVYQLEATVDQVRVSLFTTAWRKIYEDDTLPASAGQHLFRLDFGQVDLNISNGLYYVVLRVKTGGQETRKIMKLLVRR